MLCDVVLAAAHGGVAVINFEVKYFLNINQYLAGRYGLCK